MMETNIIAVENQDLYLECDDEEVNFSLADIQPKCSHDVVIKIFLEEGPKRKKFMCQLCSSQFSTGSKFAGHMENEHRIPKPFKCCHCLYSSSELKLLKQHFQKSHKKLFIFNAKQHLKNSVEDNYEHMNKKNDNCTFACKENENDSRKDGSEIQKYFACSECDYKCKQRRSLNLHAASHSDFKKSYTCKTCEKKFLCKTSLNRHSKIHTAVRAFICPVSSCGKSFKNQGALTDHNKIVHEKRSKYRMKEETHIIQPQSKNISDFSKKNGKEKFTCPVVDCRKTFRDNYNLKKHISVHEKF